MKQLMDFSRRLDKFSKIPINDCMVRSSSRIQGALWCRLLSSTVLLFVLLTAVPVARGQSWVEQAEFVYDTQQAGEDEDVPLLSPYWHSRLQQWDTLIVEEATRRALDPDFVASLVWMESAGRSHVVGKMGATGLMQVMPKEEGFSWRPSRTALLDPSTNLFWGTRTLATVIWQSKGNVFTALAAYNGGWDKIELPGPRAFAMTVLRDYAAALAMRQGLEEEAHWVAFFAVMAPDVQGPIWVADSARDDVYFFGNSNWLPEGEPLIPERESPTSIVAHCEEDDGRTYDVAVWLYWSDEDQWLAP